MVFAEDVGNLLVRDSDAGVPDFDPKPVSRAPATEQDLALVRVAHRIGEQVAKHFLEQASIALHDEAGANNVPTEVLALYLFGKFDFKRRQYLVDRKVDDARADDAGVELIDVQQRGQH